MYSKQIYLIQHLIHQKMMVNQAIKNAQLAQLEKLAKLQVKIDTASTPDARQAAIDELIEARQKVTY